MVFLCAVASGNGSRLSPIVVNGLTILVALIWAVSFVADIVLSDYTPPSSVHLALMTILGGVFGSQFVRR